MLKWIALLSMTIDHIGYYFSPYMPHSTYLALRIIGRLAFPIFAFYVAKGFTRTRNPLVYFRRMAIGAVITHLIISLAQLQSGIQVSLINPEWTNIMVLFSFAIIMLFGYDLAMRSYRDMVVSMTLVCAGPGKIKNPRYDVRVNPGGISLDPKQGIAAGTLLILISFWTVYILNADYGFYGLLTVLFFFICYDKEEDTLQFPTLWVLMITLNAGYILLPLTTGESITAPLLQSFSLAVIPLFAIWGKDHKKPTIISKYFFYVYYPVHIVMLILISRNWNQIWDFFAT
jgi:hypothetical protein